tara:strand:- start:2799 stop:2918 length:120 start_codon:yes stop_codon:yes gene_type:complete
MFNRLSGFVYTFYDIECYEIVIIQTPYGELIDLLIQKNE